MTTPFFPGSSITAEALDNLAPQILQLAVDTTPGSTTPTVLLTANVAEATYWVEGVLECVIGASSTVPKFGFYGTAEESLMLIVYSLFEATTSAASMYGGTLTAMATNSDLSGTFVEAAVLQMRFSGTVTFSAAGTFILETGLTTSGDGYTVKAGSYMIVQQAQT